jgi:hypothetical protein
MKKPAHSATLRLESLAVLLLAAGVVIALVFPVLNNYFYGDDWIDYAMYLRAGRSFVRAVLTVVPPFFRPVSYAWVIAAQLALPWKPLAHYAFLIALTLVNVFLLHRLLTLLTKSPFARALGMGVYVLSKIHATLVGVPLLLEMVAQLFQFLLVLLGIVRYLETGRRRFMALAALAFTACVFSRDASVALTAVVVFLLAVGVSPHWNVRSWRRLALDAAPFLCAAGIYVAVRLTIVGTPPVGSAGYSIGFSGSRAMAKTIEVLANVLNLSLPVNSSNGLDIVSLLPDRWATPVRWSLFGVAMVLLVWTFVRSCRAAAWACFPLLWASTVLGPILLIGPSAVYYSYEIAAATAVAVAIAADQSGLWTRAFRLSWIAVLVLVAASGYWHTRNLAVLGWFHCGELAKKIEAAIVSPNRGQDIRSVTIVADKAESVQALAYLIGPKGPGQQSAMLSTLLAPRDVSLRIHTAAHVRSENGGGELRPILDRLADDRRDLVYTFEQTDFRLERYRPFRIGRCVESFENGLDGIETTWIASSESKISLNRKPAFVSDGDASLLIESAPHPVAGAHYGGVRLPRVEGNGLAVDLYLARLDGLKAIHIWEVDAKGNPVYSWAASLPSADLESPGWKRIALVRGSDGDFGFKWNRALHAAADIQHVYVIFETAGSGAVKAYLDRLCGADQ